VHPTLLIPLNAQLAVTVIIAILGCLYLGSSTAFNALLGSSVTINNLAYILPILTNVLMRRKTLHKGAFNMGYVVGMTVNIITVIWLVFAIVFFSFPYVKPVTGKQRISLFHHILHASCIYHPGPS
jgi:choline transport protein